MRRRGTGGPGSGQEPLLIPVVSRGGERRAPGPVVTSQEESAFAGTGRRANRRRHLHRSTAAAALRTGGSCKVLVQNVQGLNWRLLAHVEKLAEIVDLLRRDAIDVALLAELHGEEDEALVYLEEFVMIATRRTAIALGPSARTS